MTQHGPPPGWPSSPAAGEFGPGFTVAGDATLRSADGVLVVSPIGPPPQDPTAQAAPMAGSVPTQGTVADPGAIFAPVVPLATAQPMPAPAPPVIPPAIAMPVPA